MRYLENVIREALINHALEDIHKPHNQRLLKLLSRKDWRTLLFTVEDHYMNRIDETQDADEQPLFKEVFMETKRMFANYFFASHWRIKRIGDWDVYQFGPVNYLNTIYFRFTIGENNGIFFWSMKDSVGNNPVSR